MDSELSTLLLNCSGGLLFIVISNTVGYTINKTKLENVHFNNSYNTFIGITVITTLIGLYFTKLQFSQLFIVIPILFYTISNSKTQIKNNSNYNYHDLIIIIGLIIGYHYTFYNTNESVINFNRDLIYYGNVTKSILEYDQLNTLGNYNYFLNINNSTSIYHFIENLAAIPFELIHKKQYAYNLQALSYPIFIFLFFKEIEILTNTRAYFIVLICVVFYNFNISLFGPFIDSILNFYLNHNPIFLPKIAIFGYFFIQIFKVEKKHIIPFLLLASYVNPVFLPTSIILSVLIIIYKSTIEENTSKDIIYLTFIILLWTLLYISSYSLNTESLFTPNLYQTLIWILKSALKNIIVAAIMALPLIIASRYIKNKIELYFSLLIIVVALISSSIFSVINFDFSQILSVPLSIILIVIISRCLTHSLYSKTISSIFIVLFAVFNFNNVKELISPNKKEQYSNDYIKQIKILVDSKNVGIYQSKNELKEFWDSNLIININNRFLGYLNCNYLPISYHNLPSLNSNREKFFLSKVNPNLGCSDLHCYKEKYNLNAVAFSHINNIPENLKYNHLLIDSISNNCIVFFD